MKKDSPRPKWSILGLILLIAATIFGLDQWSKWLVESELTLHTPVPVIPGFFNLYYVLNPGAAFSIGSGATWIFTIIIAVVIIVIIGFAPRIRSAAWAMMLGFLLGGTLGNLFDRLFREPGFGIGHVVDFIQITFFPAIFNIADIFIVTSMGLFILLSLIGINVDGSRSRNQKLEKNGMADAGSVTEREDYREDNRAVSKLPEADGVGTDAGSVTKPEDNRADS